MDVAALEAAFMEASAEEYRVEESLTALHDALFFSARSLAGFLAGEMGEGFAHLNEAARAGDEAFQPGSPEAEAFGVLIAVIGDGAFKDES